MAIEYKVNQAISPDEFIALLQKSALAEIRPVDDRDCMAGMLEKATLLVTAWHDGCLVGVARSVTDFNFCCYLAELAVDPAYQQQGIGKRLIAETQNCLGPRCGIVLLSTTTANTYYAHLGFKSFPQAWVLPRTKQV